MPFFTNASSLVFHNANFKYKPTNIQNGPSGIDILLEASCPDAAFDSSARDPPPRCWPGTRAERIESITGWARCPWIESPSPMLWMNGPAGVGKSAVAQSCAEKLESSGNIGAAFFFSSLQNRDRHDCFFPSIAYQLSTKSPDYRNLLDQKVSADKTLVSKAMARQFKSLIVEPLQELEKRGAGIGKKVIIIDGLDECADANAQREIIEIIATSVRELATPLCWAFFSRPEPHIHATFGKANIAPLLLSTLLPISRDVDRDMEFYLREGFQDILRCHNLPSPSSPWPSDAQMRTLLDAAGGLFAYGSTVLRFVCQRGSPLGPKELLDVILSFILERKNTTRAGLGHPFAELDEVYKLIMHRIPDNILPSIQLLLATMLCYSSGYLSVHHKVRVKYWGVMYLSNMLKVSESAFRILCNALQAVLWVQNQPESLVFNESVDLAHPFYDQELNSNVLNQIESFVWRLGGTMSFYHRSFVEFLVDPARSGAFCLESPTMYNRLVQHYVQTVLEYGQSYRIQGLGLVLSPGVPDSAASLSWPYMNECVNSYLKGYVYLRATLIVHQAFESLDCLDSRSYRKSNHDVALFVLTYLAGKDKCRGNFFGIPCIWYCLPGVRLYCTPPGLSDQLNTTIIKQGFAKHQELGLCQRLYPSIASRCRALLNTVVPSSTENGLYVFGQAPNQMYTYWEFDRKKMRLGGYQCIDLAAGQKAYREWVKLSGGRS